MGRRSRQRERTGDPVAGPPAAAARPSRSELRNEEARAALKPLAPGERPTAVTVAAILAFVMAVANVAAALAGADLASENAKNATVFTIGSTLLLLVAGVGMLRSKYWAVLGFQALLAIQIITLSLALLRVERWWFGLLVAAAIAALGWLFWKLVRAMARIQMPTRR